MLSYEDYIEKIYEFKPDVVGISIMCTAHNYVKNLISIIKKHFSIPIVIGGPQVSAYPKEVTTLLNADFGIFGEGEITFYELLKGLRNNKSFKDIEGLVYKDNGEFKQNHPRDLIKNLDSLPFPAWELMLPEKYRIGPILSSVKRFPIAPIVTSRGCPYKCTFCGSNITWQYKLRFRSAKNVVDEIELLINKFKVREIHITDDNFTFNKTHTINFCEELLARGLKIPWQCPNGVRIDTLDEKLLRLMKRAGCYSIGLGIESGNQEILKKVKKKLDLKKATEVLKIFKKVGIRLHGFFILGLPGETKKTIYQTIQFALSNPFDRVYFGILTPYPGSEIFSEYFGRDKLSEINWETFDLSTGILEFNDIKKEGLFYYQKKAIRMFYLRPHILWDMLRHFQLSQVKTILMTHFFKKIFSFKNK